MSTRNSAARRQADETETILKAPQKRELVNWGISLSYDVENGTTTGLLYGTGLNLDEPDQQHD